MTDSTTIALHEDVKEDLDALKVHENESYNDVVARLLDDEPGDDRADLIEDIRSQLERLDDGEPESDVGFDEIMHKLEQIESAQANTVSESLEIAESDPVDYAEIETRMERVIERMIR